MAEDSAGTKETEVASWSKVYKEPFIIDAAKMKRIVEILQSFADRKGFDCTLEFSVARNDVEYTARSMDVVLGDENLSARRIQKVTLSMFKAGGYRYPSPLECKVIFDRNPPSYSEKTVEFSIKDNDRAWASALTEELDTHIQRTLSSTNRGITKLLGSFWLNGFLIPGIVVASGLSISRKLQIAHARLGDLTVLNFAELMFVLILGSVTIFWLFGELEIGNIVARLFKDESSFYWGDEKESFDRRRAFRQNFGWIVVVGLVVAVAAGVITGFLLGR
jgi:hypothetical protein